MFFEYPPLGIHTFSFHLSPPTTTLCTPFRSGECLTSYNSNTHVFICVGGLCCVVLCCLHYGSNQSTPFMPALCSSLNENESFLTCMYIRIHMDFCMTRQIVFVRRHFSFCFLYICANKSDIKPVIFSSYGKLIGIPGWGLLMRSLDH